MVREAAQGRTRRTKGYRLPSHMAKGHSPRQTNTYYYVPSWHSAITKVNSPDHGYTQSSLNQKRKQNGIDKKSQTSVFDPHSYCPSSKASDESCSGLASVAGSRWSSSVASTSPFARPRGSSAGR
jgi:hypothetical protein